MNIFTKAARLQPAFIRTTRTLPFCAPLKRGLVTSHGVPTQLAKRDRMWKVLAIGTTLPLLLYFTSRRSKPHSDDKSNETKTVVENAMPNFQNTATKVPIRPWENLPDGIKGRVTVIEKVADLDQFDNIVKKGKSIVVIGGGSLAVAVANEAKKNGADVTEIVHEEGILSLILPKYLSKAATIYFKKADVDVICNTMSSYFISRQDERVIVATASGPQILADHVIISDIEPVIQPVEDSPGVASFGSTLGSQTTYEGIGVIDSKLQTLSVWAKNGVKEDYEKGVIFYLQEEKIVGILLWNWPGKREEARRIVSEKPVRNQLNNLVERLGFRPE